MRLRPIPIALCVMVAAVATASLVGVRQAARAEAGVVSGSRTGGPRYGLSTAGLSYPFAAAIAKGFSDAAARAGASAVVLDAKGDVQKQANDIDDLIAQRVAGIAVMPLDSVVAQGWVRRANAQNVPIAAVAALVGDPKTRSVEDVYPGLVALASQDEVAAGRAAGSGAALAAARPAGADRDHRGRGRVPRGRAARSWIPRGARRMGRTLCRRRIAAR